MGFITVCSEQKVLRTSLGEVEFHKGEAKLDADVARKLIAKFPGLIWSKKKGRPDDAPMEDGEELEKPLPKRDKPQDKDNFGFDDNVHVSSRARKAMLQGKVTAGDILDRTEKAINNVTPPSTDIMEDMVRGNAAVDGSGGKPRKLNVVSKGGEDVSEDAPRKAPAGKVLSKKHAHKVKSKR